MTSHEDQRYRREQEEFVSNHGGSSSREVILVILPNICGIILTASTLALIGKHLNNNVRIFIEFCLNIVPCVLCCTVFSESVINVCLTMLGISFINFMTIILRNKNSVKSSIRMYTGRRSFVTNFRALTNIITAICILSVDFRVFPRKFAKTEVYGYSLMDTGVGLFVISNALVAPEARDFDERRDRSLVRRMAANSKVCVKNCAPLLILGIGRFLAIEYSGYHKHVSEYGVHWNFFITLAFVKMFTSTVATAISSRYSLISGLWILIMHEYALSTKDLRNWILGNAARNDFVSANREGLVSVPGYAALYLIGIAIGRLIHSTYRNLEKRMKYRNERYAVGLRFFGRQIDFEYNDSMILCIKLSLIAVQACAATLYCESYFKISRRLANSGYCCWIVTLSCTILTLLLLVEIKTDIILHAVSGKFNTANSNVEDRSKKKKHVGFKMDDKENETTTRNMRTPEIFEAVNYNGLAFFLIANLFTGLVNMSIKTLYVKEIQALQIILAYIAICITIALLLYRYNVQLRL